MPARPRTPSARTRPLLCAGLLTLAGVGCASDDPTADAAATKPTPAHWLDAERAMPLEPLNPDAGTPHWERRIVTSAQSILTLSAIGGPDGSVRLADEADDWPEPIDFGPRFAGVTRLGMDPQGTHLYIEAAQHGSDHGLLYTYDLTQRMMQDVRTLPKPD